MAADRQKERLEGGDVGQLAAEDGRHQVALEHLPGGLDGFIRVPGPFAGHALAPVRPAADLEPDEERIAVLLDTEAGSKRLQQAHL